MVLINANSASKVKQILSTLQGIDVYPVVKNIFLFRTDLFYTTRAHRLMRNLLIKTPWCKKTKFLIAVWSPQLIEQERIKKI